MVYTPPSNYNKPNSQEQNEQEEPVKKRWSIGDWQRKRKLEKAQKEQESNPVVESQNRYQGKSFEDKFGAEEHDMNEKDEGSEGYVYDEHGVGHEVQTDSEGYYRLPQKSINKKQSVNGKLFNYLVENGHLDSMEFKLSFKQLKTLIEEMNNENS